MISKNRPPLSSEKQQNPSANLPKEKPSSDSKSPRSRPISLPPAIIARYSKYRNTKNKFHKVKVLNTIFEIEDKYNITDAIGLGAYGLVVSATEKTSKKKDDPGTQLAIKKVEKPFEHKVLAKRTLRELKIMRLLQHDNIIQIDKILLPKAREDFEDVYLCMPILEADLASIIKSSQQLSEDLIKFLIYQILRGLKYIHSAGILHRDIKPRNLLVNSECDLKICDFGISKTMHCKYESKDMTDYVGTRWYRAPELFFESNDYGPHIDVWSVGCILAELYRRRPLFQGASTKDQLDQIFDVFGTPDEELIQNVTKPGIQKMLRAYFPVKPKDLRKMFPKADELAIDLLEKLMKLDYRKRITVDEALRHPYLEDLHDPSDEPTTELVSVKEFEFEKYALSNEQIKDLLYEEILLYHFEDFKKEYMRRMDEDENPYLHIIENENKVKAGQTAAAE